MDAFAWGVVASVAGVVCAAAAIVFGVIPLVRDRRSGRSDPVDSEGKDARPGLSGMVLPAPVLDVEVRGREDVVAELADIAGEPDGLVRVLAGMGGCGKSTVARALAARVRSAGGRVWWVPAANEVSLTQLLLGLAGELGAPEGQVEAALAGRVNPSDVLWHHLEAARGWLLVLDNADDLAALAVGDRVAGSGSGWLRATRAGLVLVTSRMGDAQAWGPLAEVRHLDPLEQADGGQVLLDLAAAAGDRVAAQRLADRLGGLPLALHQAGSYLASPFATERGFVAYEQALAARFGELMGRGEDDRAKVIATWELSLAALAAQGKQGAGPLLRVLSCFASSVSIPALLLDHELLASSWGSTAAVEDSLAGLLSVGLIGLPQAAGNALPDVKVHPLVAETIRYRAGADLRASLEQAVELFSAAVARLDHQDPSAAAGWLVLLPHLQTLQQARIRMPAEAEASLARATVQVSVALLWGGRYAASLAVAESGLHREHGLQGDQSDVLGLRERRASAWQFLGSFEDAQAEFREVLDVRRQSLGPDDLVTLATRHNYAHLLAQQGKSAQAEAEYRQVLDAELRVLGPDDRTTLATWHALAAVLLDEGRLADAEAEFRQVLDARLRVLGPDHPSTLATRNQIARMLAEQGRLADAEAESREVLDARLRVLGPDHPSTLVTLHNIAAMLAEQGRLADAEAEFRQVLDVRLRVLGPDHPSTLATRNQIAQILTAQGQPTEAAAEFRQILDARLRVLGPDHPSTLATRRLVEGLEDAGHE